MAGPALGGYLLAQKFAITFSFLVFAAPGVVAVIAVLLISSRRVRAEHPVHTLASQAK
jgi:AAHS family benzoate transporter-like MFS transporter